MAISNRERVGRALDSLKEGLYPFVDREMKQTYGKQWTTMAINCLPESYTTRKTADTIFQEDVSALLIVMWEYWNDVFKKTLGRSDRSLVSELRETRNSWAHNSSFSLDDTYRAFDSITRLLNAVSGDTQEVEKQKQEILRARYEEQAKRETRRKAEAPTEGQPSSGLKPWREIATPHPDVASGRYQQAEFAADLWQVYQDEGSDEYRLPTEFFRRTYLTEGLKKLLSNALIRLTGKGGDPVIELQTNFGGGKTHAILALYHMFFGLQPHELPGLDPVFEETSIKELPQNVNTVVIVGNKISPGTIYKKSDGTQIRTLWGEIAWQLGGKEGYEMVRDSDQTATNPGDTLKHLFNRYAPCMILIDEWVAYARQLHEQPDLPGGSFDTHFTFAQTLSESAKNADRTLLVVSIPSSSDNEIGGDRGKQALDRLKNAMGRVESPWRPSSAEESFEIVRRRLFETTTNPDLFVERDRVIRAFYDMYRQQKQEFPSECAEAKYQNRLKESYPIHPEIFDRLYSEWSTLDKFQRTRGVLRLMAKVIHSLWEREDKGLLIMPGQIPMDDAQVQSELTRYLDDNWVPIIEKDVDGINSLPLEIDRQNTPIGRYSACRRVARTIYLGSAPIQQAANIGLEEQRIKLGCVQPGEVVATFVDALRRLTDRATYLYIDGNRYWISNQPNVTRTAQDRTNQFLEELYKVTEEIIRRLKSDKERGEFTAIHTAPDSSSDIPDDPNLGVRLVVLSPELQHNKAKKNSSAIEWIKDVLNHRGTSRRYYKNTLVFIGAEEDNIENLNKNVAQYLAWDSILNDKDTLNLNVSQTKQATAQKEQSEKYVKTILNQTYQWLISPEQPNPHEPIEINCERIPGEGSPILRASRQLVNDGQLITEYSSNTLRMEALDKYLWRDTNHIDLKQLWEYLAQYVYLPRLKNPEVLLEAVKNGLQKIDIQNHFGYAEGWEESKQKYINLVVLHNITPSISSENLIVKPEIATKQLKEEQVKELTSPSRSESTSKKPIQPTQEPTPTERTRETKPQLKRFHGTVEIDPLRINRDAPAIANEIIQHLTSLNDAKVRIVLEIEADIPDGVPDDVVRTVTENCRTLKFNSQAFEQE
ncbi:Swt1 family HEPN domain-containing protein [Cylindrospermopsis raciborskii]|uniref:Swt1 family HEPN domain-containing protein n=1 Tax=Cylindrospermopsis raciborskii TaxID=77022 RepID=UPI003DA47588